jgi:hypothetical protein
MLQFGFTPDDSDRNMSNFTARLKLGIPAITINYQSSTVKLLPFIYDII